jgi:hypothetical protein
MISVASVADEMKGRHATMKVNYRCDRAYNYDYLKRLVLTRQK